MESKPSPLPAEDIRIANPFPELVKFSDAIELKELDEKAFKHIPYVVILIKLIQQWKESHGGEFPANFKEKSEFQDLIKVSL